MKPVLNPSRLKDLAKCGFLGYIKYVENKTLLPKLAPKREFGTLVHEAEGAHDSGKNVKRALTKKVKEWRTSFWYNVGYSKDITLMEVEALKLHEGGTFTDGKDRATKVESYQEWFNKNLKDTAVVDVEKRLFVDVGPVILAPKLDLVIKTKGWFETGREDYWVVERKTTMRWNDVGWQDRWSLDGQTSLQLIAAEEHYKKEFAGVMVEPIQYTRQNRKDIKDLQPIGKVERLPMKWIRKPQAATVRMMNLLEDIVGGLYESSEADGMLSGACDYCDMRKYCLGLDTELYAREPDDIDRFLKRRDKK